MLKTCAQNVMIRIEKEIEDKVLLLFGPTLSPLY
jgi:hypothetical protein